MAVEVKTRTWNLIVLVLLVAVLVAAAIGLFLVHQPRLDPVPVPSVSKA